MKREKQVWAFCWRGKQVIIRIRFYKIKKQNKKTNQTDQTNSDKIKQYVISNKKKSFVR